MSKRNQQVPVDAIKAVWEKYSDIMMEEFSDQLDHLVSVDVSTKNTEYWRFAKELAKVIEKMRAFRHEFNKKT